MVEALEGKRLLVTLLNGVAKVYDCQVNPESCDRFQLLRHEAYFKAVTVDPGGEYGECWDDEMDWSEYELWNNGIEVDQSTHASPDPRLVGPARCENTNRKLLHENLAPWEVAGPT